MALEKKICLISSMYFCYFLIIEETWIPFTQGYFVPIKFGWNWPSGSGEEDENVKTLQTDGRRTTGDLKTYNLNFFFKDNFISVYA